MIQISKNKSPGWLLFFYSLPSKPVGNRIKIWRKLSRIGAVPFKGGGYLLPDRDDHYESFQWLVSDITGLGGEAAFVRTDRIESVAESEPADLFRQFREKDYRLVEEKTELLERRLNSRSAGGSTSLDKKMNEDFKKLAKEFERINKIDFFSSAKGVSLGKHLEALEGTLKNLSLRKGAKPEEALSQKKKKDYQEKIWVTRKNPYVDRMASAWLIRKFIDTQAIFSFTRENELTQPRENRVTFDLKQGDFTHRGDLCTFEVLIKAFGLKDQGLKKMSRIVHTIDLHDEKYSAPEAKGVEEILKGIRKTGRTDLEKLEKGMAVFEMLYESITG